MSDTPKDKDSGADAAKARDEDLGSGLDKADKAGKVDTAEAASPANEAERERLHVAEEIRAVNDIDDPDDDEYYDDRPTFRAHWHIFIPSMVIAIAYGVGLGLLHLTGGGEGSLARLFILVLAVGVPLLLAHAVLRYFTIRVQLGEDTVRYHDGWPRRLPVDLPVSVISSVHLRRGIAGRLFGGGTVTLSLVTGDRVSISDLREPEQAIEGIRQLLAAQA